MDTVTTSASLIETMPALETRPKPVVLPTNGTSHKNGTNGTVFNEVKPLTDKEKVSQILSSLENVRLSLVDSSSQGFLFRNPDGE